MRLELHPVTELEAREITSWHYPDPYAGYDPGPGAFRSLMDVRNNYHAVLDEDQTLVGFFCYGHDAQVPGELTAAEEDDESTLDVGLGMRPDLTGRGYGVEFVNAGLAFGRARFGPARFRLAVLTFNRRAIATYLHAGFAPVRVFPSPSLRGPREYLLMEREV